MSKTKWTATAMTQRDANLKRLKRLLAAARRRAKYWSGVPSFRGFGFAGGVRSRGDHPDLEYETALDDCEAVASDIEQLTGKKPKVTDYRQDFRDKWSEMQYPAGDSASDD